MHCFYSNNYDIFRGMSIYFEIIEGRLYYDITIYDTIFSLNLTRTNVIMLQKGSDWIKSVVLVDYTKSDILFGAHRSLIVFYNDEKNWTWRNKLIRNQCRSLVMRSSEAYDKVIIINYIHEKLYENTESRKFGTSRVINITTHNVWRWIGCRHSSACRESFTSEVVYFCASRFR